MGPAKPAGIAVPINIHLKQDKSLKPLANAPLKSQNWGRFPDNGGSPFKFRQG